MKRARQKLNNLIALSIALLLTGPLTAAEQGSLSSDSSRSDRKKGITQYIGNVKYNEPNLKLTANELRELTKEQRELIASGIPVTVTQTNSKGIQTTQALTVRYYPKYDKILAKDQVLLDIKSKNGQSILVKADDMEIIKTSNSEFRFVASGAPIQLTLQKPGSETVEAYAGSMAFDSASGQVELNKDVKFERQQELVKAEKFLYNVKTEVWEVPAIKNKRVEVIKRKST